MLPWSELKKYAFIRGLKNAAQIRLDYVQDVVLFLAYREEPDLIFKGGTCLWKLFKLPRFSEDVDLVSGRGDDPTPAVMKGMEFLGFEVELEKNKKTANTVFSRLKISAENFGSTWVSLQVGLREEEGSFVNFRSPYPDIRDFTMKVPSLEKIAEDKVSAIMQRNKPRDLFDLHFLVSRHGVSLPPQVKSKAFAEGVEAKRKQWRTLEGLVLGGLPDFDEVAATVSRS